MTTTDYDSGRDFKRSDRPTMGLEWELALVDPETCALKPVAPQVLDHLDALEPGHGVEREFLANTIELVTGVHDNTAGAIEQIAAQLRLAQRAAAEHNALVWSSGTHPTAHWADTEVSAKDNYQRIIDRTQYWGRQMLIWGVHVHVGVSHEAKVMPIIHEVMRTYPHLLALSASSPYWDGVDTGYASHRTMLYQQLPTAGFPYGLETWEQWVGYIQDQMHSGVVDNPRQLHWDIRPAPRLGTIEIRVCDGASNLRELAALSALMHCLVVDADRRLENGEPLQRLQPWFIKENKWRAARYGLDAEIITSRQCDEALVTEEILTLLNRLEPTARDLGCAEELALVEEIPRRGAGYQRQRAVAAQSGRLEDVVRHTAEEMRTLTLG